MSPSPAVHLLYLAVGCCGQDDVMKKTWQLSLNCVANGHHTQANMDDGTVETIVIDVVNSDYAVDVVEDDTDDNHVAAENDIGDILRRGNGNPFKKTCKCN